MRRMLSTYVALSGEYVSVWFRAVGLGRAQWFAAMRTRVRSHVVSQRSEPEQQQLTGRSGSDNHPSNGWLNKKNNSSECVCVRPQLLSLGFTLCHPTPSPPLFLRISVLILCFLQTLIAACVKSFSVRLCSVLHHLLCQSDLTPPLTFFFYSPPYCLLTVSVSVFGQKAPHFKLHLTWGPFQKAGLVKILLKKRLFNLKWRNNWLFFQFHFQTKHL